MDPEKLSGYQFQVGTRFHDVYGGGAGETVVTAHRQGDNPSYTPPVAALRISHGGITAPRTQKKINDETWEHGVNEDEHGQRFWTGGSFDKPWISDVDTMDWLGSTDRNPHLLRGLLATAGVEHVKARGHGRLHADSRMTEDSARIARRLSKSMDLKPHPANPNMESVLPDFKNDDDFVGGYSTRVHRIAADFLQPVSSEEIATNVGTIFGKGPRKKRSTGPQPEQLSFDI